MTMSLVAAASRSRARAGASGARSRGATGHRAHLVHSACIRSGSTLSTRFRARASSRCPGAPIENGTIVFRDGVIAAVGANATVPAGRAVVIAGKGSDRLSRPHRHGEHDGHSTMPATPRAENPRTTEDVERVKADYLLRPQFRAADYVNPVAAPLARAAATGITSILATPAGDAIRGQSALINTALGDDDPQIGAVADERRGALVLKTPVALHVTFSEQPAGGNAYPNSLMGVDRLRAAVVPRCAALVRLAQADDAAASRRLVVAAGLRAGARGAAAGARRAACRSRSRRDARARFFARWTWRRRFKLDPIVTNAREADQVATRPEGGERARHPRA